MPESIVTSAVKSFFNFAFLMFAACFENCTFNNRDMAEFQAVATLRLTLHFLLLPLISSGAKHEDNGVHKTGWFGPKVNMNHRFWKDVEEASFGLE